MNRRDGRGSARHVKKTAWTQIIIYQAVGARISYSDTGTEVCEQKKMDVQTAVRNDSQLSQTDATTCSDAPESRFGLVVKR